MTIDTADRAALLQKQELDSKESFDSGDSFYVEHNNGSGRRMSWLPSRSHVLVHVGVLLLYTIAFIAALVHVLYSRAGKADIPIAREDFQSKSGIALTSTATY